MYSVSTVCYTVSQCNSSLRLLLYQSGLHWHSHRWQSQYSEMPHCHCFRYLFPKCGTMGSAIQYMEHTTILKASSSLTKHQLKFSLVSSQCTQIKKCCSHHMGELPQIAYSINAWFVTYLTKGYSTELQEYYFLSCLIRPAENRRGH